MGSVLIDFRQIIVEMKFFFDSARIALLKPI